jgi:hypothetical protein
MCSYFSCNIRFEALKRQREREREREREKEIAKILPSKSDKVAVEEEVYTE